MTYGETAVGQRIDRLLSEHPDLDAAADGALDNLDQFHAGGPMPFTDIRWLSGAIHS
jgi:hypothetical protein